jgi:hypothetical protein
MVQTAASPSVSSYVWFDLVSLSGGEGVRWCEEYRRYEPVTTQIMESVPMLRRGELAEGGRLLDRAWDALGSLEVPERSVRSVVERWYYGALGMYHYRRADFDEADRVMVRAHDLMAEAIGRRSFLLALADEAVELRLHRARIARNRQRWAEMWEHIEAARAMREGGAPYYVLDDGTPVWLSDVTSFLDSLPVPEEARPIKPHLQDAVQRRQDTERFVRDVLRIPGSVIHAP